MPSIAFSTTVAAKETAVNAAAITNNFAVAPQNSVQSAYQPPPDNFNNLPPN